MKLFELAQLELLREGKDPNNKKEVVKRTITIIEWLRKHGKHTRAIMQGAEVYCYGNQIKTYLKIS